jgi:hypothetical protein
MTKLSGSVNKCFRCLAVGVGLLTGEAIAQLPTINPVVHLRFDTPEAWALKHFASMTLMSGLQPPEPLVEGRRIGSITVGFETGWMPTLTPEQARVGFSGKKEEDLNKAPIFARPIVRVGLPWKFSIVAAGPAPIRAFGVSPRLVALGLERPIVERSQWRIGWRGYGQFGSVKGAFTCPQKVLAFPAGPNNPSACTGYSADEITLRYAGTEIQFSHRMPGMPRLTPHAAAGFNVIDGIFQVNAPLATKIDHTRLWARGTTFSGTAGLSYLLTQRMGITVDAFYSPLSVQRQIAGPRQNDGLFNVRALLSYRMR